MTGEVVVSVHIRASYQMLARRLSLPRVHVMRVCVCWANALLRASRGSDACARKRYACAHSAVPALFVAADWTFDSVKRGRLSRARTHSVVEAQLLV